MRARHPVMSRPGAAHHHRCASAVLSCAVAIVDTNNPAELPEGVEKVSIHSIIDHHKLSGLTTSAPLEMDVRSLCSTGSILYSRAKAAGRTPPPAIAGLLLSCILSDSLDFRSPTTTPLDRELAEELGPHASYEGSPMSRGELQFDLWGVTPSERWDWAALRERIQRHGVRNYNDTTD